MNILINGLKYIFVSVLWSCHMKVTTGIMMSSQQTPIQHQEFNFFAKPTNIPRQCTWVYLVQFKCAAHTLPQRQTAWTRSKHHKRELSPLWMAVTLCAPTAWNGGGINSCPIWANVWDEIWQKVKRTERKLHYNALHCLLSTFSYATVPLWTDTLLLLPGVA
jgi:hypothetical protein